MQRKYGDGTVRVGVLPVVVDGGIVDRQHLNDALPVLRAQSASNFKSANSPTPKLRRLRSEKYRYGHARPFEVSDGELGPSIVYHYEIGIFGRNGQIVVASVLP